MALLRCEHDDRYPAARLRTVGRPRRRAAACACTRKLWRGAAYDVSADKRLALAALIHMRIPV